MDGMNIFGGLAAGLCAAALILGVVFGVSYVIQAIMNLTVFQQFLLGAAGAGSGFIGLLATFRGD